MKENLAQDDRFTKKARRLEEEPPDTGGGAPSNMDVEVVSDTNPVIPTAPISYRDTLLKDNPKEPLIDDEILDEEDVEVFEDDVVRGVVNGLISIDFSDRVQAIANKSFDHTILVKLLGRHIGYTTLRNKLYDLWKPSQPFRLMDIENDYFLVSLRTRSDFLTALSDGPWTIFGHYLTVEPWSPDFTSSQLFPSRIVAWIRLPGLPVTLYKRSLITKIGECIGKVVKIDYQTETGRRGRFARMAVSVDLKKPLTSKLLINGRVQIVEYESLPTICFSCVDDVTAVAFDNQATYTSKVTHTPNAAQTPHAHHASHGPNVSHASNVTNALSSANHAQSNKIYSNSQHITKNKMTALARKPLMIPKITARSSKGSQGQSRNQSRQINVKPRVTILDRLKHSAIVLAENTNPNIIDDMNLQALRGTTKHKSIPGEPPDINQIQSSEAFSKRTEADATTSPTQRDDVMPNNCTDSQTGCGHPRFLTTFQKYLRDFKPIIAILEPRISGIELMLSSPPLFIHCCSTTCGKFSTLATIIYANPNATKRKQLWPHLRSLAGNTISPWIMIGDFNSTLTASDRMNGAISTQPCKYFQDFVYDFGIRDMGFQGLEFTWNRGLSYARLDRALCNSKWDELYPETAIHHLHRMRSDHSQFSYVLQPTLTFASLNSYFSGWLQQMISTEW
ncbi:hypothetical protein F3Y22_tig00110831pilonHSYRG00417 [Hibiscus syriacus]|uniref:DUF4283 domain-containing protein n=1 Tax=Hibiscus syriacus TaxID=106335 RepID=A0A6A2ZP48_HIBSY|nr:hypothetical protein F3Y22_tig00110831pilonHSYRG00417 [Hibiscus syriacus]